MAIRIFGYLYEVNDFIMKKVFSVDEYIEDNLQFQEALNILRTIMLATELEESIKWNYPVYALNNKNVLSIGAFKNHFCIWFFNGVFLKDKLKVLRNAQEGKTKAMRQMRFKHVEDIDRNLVFAYVKEAIENQKLGKEIKPDRSKKPVIIPTELQVALNTNKNLKSSFHKLSNSKQREYCEFIETAKRDVTKQTRLAKITPLIIGLKGLHDQYKNC